MSVGVDVSKGLALLANNTITSFINLNELAEYAVYLRHKQIANPAESARWLHELAKLCEEEIK